MARRFHNEPLFEMAGSGGHRPRWAVRVAMLLLAVLALAAAFGLLPLGPAALSSRQAGKLLSDARKWEEESLYRSAAEAYQKVADNQRVKPELRRQAAERLHLLYRDQLNDPAAAEAALEKVYRFTPLAQRDSVRQDLESLRGYPMTPAPAAATTRAAATAAEATPAPGHEIARIGRERVTLEDILYAWQRSNPNAPPSDDELGPFVRNYLDMVLLSAAAEDRELDRRGRTAHELQFSRLMALNSAMLQLIVENLAEPSPAELEQFYRESASTLLAGGARTRLGHILVGSQSQADRVARLLAQGGDFGQLAGDFSRDANELEQGYELGAIGPRDLDIPRFGRAPGLAARLCAMDVDTTTGPLRSERGWHFFKVLGREVPPAPPLEKVREEVLMLYQRHQLALERQRMLQELRANYPIQMAEAQIAGALREQLPATAPQTTATTATTATQAAAPAAEAPDAPDEADAAPSAAAQP